MTNNTTATATEHDPVFTSGQTIGYNVGLTRKIRATEDYNAGLIDAWEIQYSVECAIHEFTQVMRSNPSPINPRFYAGYVDGIYTASGRRTE